MRPRVFLSSFLRGLWETSRNAFRVSDTEQTPSDGGVHRPSPMENRHEPCWDNLSF